MLHNLDFLQKGNSIPPKDESLRISNYNKNFKLYDGDYKPKDKVKYKTFEELYKEVEFDVKKVNLYKLVTNKFIALLLNEKPIVKVNGDNDSRVTSIISNSNFWGVMQKAYTSFSSVGDGVVYTYSNNGPKITATSPTCWYKVVSENNIDDVLYQVLIWEIENRSKVRVQIHEKGRYFEYVADYKSGKIGDKVTYRQPNKPTISKKGRWVNTGISDFAVISMSNNTSVHRIYGISDYKDIEELVKGVEKRLSLEDTVIDKHIEPTFTGPSNLMTENEQTGRAEFSGIGGFIPINSKDSPQPGYITWDGKTEASEKMIDRLLQLIYTITEYGEVFFTGTYANASGEALKTLLKSALDKVSRQIDSLEYPTKQAIKGLLELDGIQVDISDISISWQDGISESLATVTNTINSRVAGKTLSLKHSLMKYDNMTEEQADNEINAINEEHKEIDTKNE